MVFDDYASVSELQPPSGTHMESYISGDDEAEFLYSEELTREGETGIRTTKGDGSDKCKDALISLVVRRRPKQKLRNFISAP